MRNAEYYTNVMVAWSRFSYTSIIVNCEHTINIDPVPFSYHIAPTAVTYSRTLIFGLDRLSILLRTIISGEDIYDMFLLFKQDRSYDALLKVITFSCNILICSLILSTSVICPTIINSNSWHGWFLEAAFYVTHLYVSSLFWP